MKLMAAYRFINMPTAHAPQIDADYVGAFLFETATEPADPQDLIQEESEWENLPKAPPPISGYRDADIQGVACWNCAHFTIVGDPDKDNDLDGICNLFEAQAEATKTCDRFTAHADLLRQSPHTTWAEDIQNLAQDQARYGGVTEAEYSDTSVFNTINFSSIEATEEDNLVWKEILRTGEWKQTPTAKGIIDKKLQIVDEGESDPVNGIISLSELEENFNDQAVPYVTVPLSDDLNDHKNIARLNTGFVRKLRRRERDGITVLEAGISFTEPDVKGKVLRGTIPDVSAGIPFGVTRRSDKKFFRSVLDHVCLTRRPFVDKLLPFGIAAADGDELPVEAWEQEAGETSTTPSPSEDHSPPSTSESTLSFRQQSVAIRNALTNQLRLGPEYQVDDISGTNATISHRTSKCRWEVLFRLTDQAENPVVVASVDKWKLIDKGPETEQVAASNTNIDQLRHYRELRELRLAQPTSNSGGIQMSVLNLDGVELSDVPEEARARIQSILDENQTLRRDNISTKVDQRIEELKKLPNLNLADRPGALKLYRQIMLDDDGGPAVVLFSEKPEEERERLTALQILDRFIDGLKADSGVQLSDQQIASANDQRPPNDATNERKPLDERVEETRKALYGDKNKRRTGRK